MDGERVELDRRAGRPDRPILRLAGVASREAMPRTRRIGLAAVPARRSISTCRPESHSGASSRSCSGIVT